MVTLELYTQHACMNNWKHYTVILH